MTNRTDQLTALEDLAQGATRAAEDAEKARQRRDQAIRNAHTAGMSIRTIAHIVAMSPRQTHRIIQDT